MNPQETPIDPAVSRSPGARTFLVTSLVFFVLSMLMLAGRPNFLLTPVLTGHGVAWMDLLIFGFGFSGVYGLVYQAIPKAFGVPLFSEKMVFLHFAFHLAGMLLSLAGVIFKEFPQASMGPALLLCSALTFAINAGGSLKSMPRPDAAAAFLVGSILWLLVASFLGMPFTDKPPFAMFGGNGWSAGWLVLTVGGFCTNAALGLALRLTPKVLNQNPLSSSGAWSAFVFTNTGLAWLFAGMSIGPWMFTILCAAVYVAGILVYLAVLTGLLQRSASHLQGWDTRMLYTAVCMIPVAAGLIIWGCWEEMTIPPPDPALAETAAAPVEEKTGVLPLEFSAVNGAIVLTSILAVMAPALVALAYQLFRLEHSLPGSPAEVPFRTKLGSQILLASFFNYAVGVLMVIPAAWAGIGQILSLGTLFLLVGAAGFLGNFFYFGGNSRPVETAGNASPLTA